jgi:hypothetical protein
MLNKQGAKIAPVRNRRLCRRVFKGGSEIMRLGGNQVSKTGRGPVGTRSRGGQSCQGLSIHSFRKSERGQELAEFAIILPVLFLLLFAALDLGRLFFASISIANAAREGAR